MARILGTKRARRLIVVALGSVMALSPAPAAQAAPSAPSDLRATAGDSVVMLGWGPAEGLLGVDSYNVYRDGSRIASVDGDVTAYTDEAVWNGGCFRYWVTATDALSEGPGSNTAEACPAPPEPPEGAPSAPRNLTAHEQRFEGHSTVTLTWKPPSDEGSSRLVQYRIYEDSDLVGAVPAHQRQFRTEFEHRGAGTDYSVTAVNEAGEGPAAWVRVGPCLWC